MMSESDANLTPPASPKSGLVRLGGIVLFGFLAFWLCSPFLTSVHLEAFSAQVQTMAVLANVHGARGITLSDQAFPVTSEYLYMSRSGLVAALQIAMRILGTTSDLPFRLTMIVSMAVFAVCIVTIARRWSKEPAMLLVTALLLTPGLVEIGFFFSDNLPSAALAMLALALVPREKQSDLRWLAIGALFAMAALVRVDAMFIAPAFLVCLFLQRPKLAVVAARAGLGLAGFLGVFLLAQHFTPFRAMESIHVSKTFEALHIMMRSTGRDEEVGVGFFGIVTPVLVALGLIRNCRTYGWRWIEALVVLPLIFYTYAVSQALEIRMFMLLGAPAILIHASAGLRVLWEQWKSPERERKVLALSALGLTLFALFGPVMITIRDGPRTPYGRVWGTIAWLEWQRSVNNGLLALGDVADSVQPGETVLAITSHYNPDDYLRLVLLQHGYDILPVGQLGERNPGAIEAFRKGNRTVIHVRCPDPYFILTQWGKQPTSYSQPFQIVSALDCITPRSYNRAVMMNWALCPMCFVPILDLKGDPPPWQVTLPQSPIVPAWGRANEGRMDVEWLSADQVLTLYRSAAGAISQARRSRHGWKPMTDYAELRKLFEWRYGPVP
ncbi:MAG: glycosyltransferase family 39 protein [Fimbriimonas sp.]|nr:glycosyltransferase family 39 protein [Fimbriimonas sp.]